MKKIFRFLVTNQLAVQSWLLWALALINIMNYSFWLFAIPAIIISGMQDILDGIRKLNNNNDTGTDL